MSIFMKDTETAKSTETSSIIAEEENVLLGYSVPDKAMDMLAIALVFIVFAVGVGVGLIIHNLY